MGSGGATSASAVVPRQARRTAVDTAHLLVGELAQDGVRQDLFYEIVVLQDIASPACERSASKAGRIPILSQWSRPWRRHDRLHERDSLYGLAVAVGPVEAEGG